MTRKTQSAYKHLFEYIHKNICSLECNSFTSDYELAMRNALIELFPNARMVACWFHYSQALKRKVSQIPGFERFLRGSMEAEEIYYKFQCLPLLPPGDIFGAFQTLKKAALKCDKRFEPFLKYFERQWIEQVSHFCLVFCLHENTHSVFCFCFCCASCI